MWLQLFYFKAVGSFYNLKSQFIRKVILVLKVKIDHKNEFSFCDNIILPVMSKNST